MFDGIEIIPEDLLDKRPNVELDYIKFERGRDIVKIQEMLFRNNWNKEYFDIDDNGIFTNGNIGGWKLLLKISIEIYKIAKKLKIEINKKTIFKAIKVWYLMNKENGNLFKMFPECYLKSWFPKDLLETFHILAEIYERASENRMLLVKTIKDWYLEKEANNELPNFPLEKYLGNIFSEEMIDNFHLQIGATSKKGEEKLIKQNAMIMIQLQEIVEKENLIIKLLKENEKWIQKALETSNRHQVVEFLGIPESTLRIFLKKYSSGLYDKISSLTKTVEITDKIRDEAYEKWKTDKLLLEQIAKWLKVDKQKLSHKIKERYGDDAFKRSKSIKEN